MKHSFKMALLFFVLMLFKSISLCAQSPYIYGIVYTGEDSNYLGRLNYLTGKFDSIMDLGKIISVNGACSDPYHNRYFFCGVWEGHSGNYHIIDLNTFSVESFSSRDAGDIEFNPYNNSLVFQVDADFCSINLSNKTINCQALPIVNNCSFGAKASTFITKDTSFVYINCQHTPSVFSILVIDALTGIVKCMKDTLSAFPGIDFVVDNSSGNVYCHNNEKVLLLDRCTGNTIQLLNIPSYESHYGSQMAVFDQEKKKYIVPYASNNYSGKIAVIDMIKNKIDTIYSQPDHGFNFQVLAYYPVGIEKLQYPNIPQIFPNPNNGLFTININQTAKSIKIFNLTGKLLYTDNNLKRQTSINIDLSDLQKGIYFARIQDSKQVVTEKIIIQ